MEEISYLKILKQAFFVTWKNKFLWIFGFIIFLGSTLSNIDFNYEDVSKQIERMGFLTNIAQNYPNSVLALSAVLTVLALLLFFLKFVAKTAIIKSVNNIELYKQLKFKNIFFEARQYFWRLALLDVLVTLVLVLILAVLAIPVIYLFELKNNFAATLMLVTALLIALPLMILVYYLIEYGTFFLVLSDLKIRIALEFAYLTFRKNLKKSLKMGLISLVLLFCLFLIIVLFSIGVVLMLLPFGLIEFFLFDNSGLWVSLSVGAIFEFIVTCLLFSGFVTFLQIAWFLFFKQITLEKQKIEKSKVKEGATSEVIDAVF